MSPKPASFVLLSVLVAFSLNGCLKSTDDIKREQEEAWATRVEAIVRDIDPVQERTTEQLREGFMSGDITQITQAFADFDRDVRSFQERVDSIDPPPQCADEQRAFSRFIAIVRRTNARLSDPTLKLSDLPVILSRLDPLVRQAESDLRKVLGKTVRKGRC